MGAGLHHVFLGLMLTLMALTIGIPKGFSKMTIAKQGGKTIYQIEVEGVKQTLVDVDGEAFTQITLVGVEGFEGANYEPGRPGIPVIRFFVEGDGQVAVVPGSVFEDLSPVRHLVYPFQMSMTKNFQGIKPFFFDAASYGDDEFTPAKPFEISEAGQVRGVKRRLVTLHPYYYKASTGEQKYRKHFKVIVGKGTAVAESGERPGILFVVGEKFVASPSLKKYLDFKTGQGFQVFQSSITGDLKTPEQIREKIKSFYYDTQNNLRYVILVGDVEDVASYPAKELFEGAVTDHFYRAIDTDDYDKDLNGPDVGVGRFSVTSEAELDAVVAKYINYQNNQENRPWMSKLTFLATDDEYNAPIAEKTHDFIIQQYTGRLGFSGNFPTLGNPGGDQLYATRHSAMRDDLMKALQDGRAIVNYSGHGTPSSWLGPEFQIEDLDLLPFDGSHPFVISNSCETARFTEANSFAEAWQRHPKGAVMFWGSMDVTMWDEDDILERATFARIFRDAQRDFTELTNPALAEVWRYYGGGGRSRYYWETYMLFGDPSMRLRLAQ